MEFWNDFYGGLLYGGGIIFIVILVCCYLLLLGAFSNYVAYVEDGNELSDEELKEYDIVKRILISVGLTSFIFIVGYFIVNPDISEDANLKNGKHKDVYAVSENFDGLIGDYKKVRFALNDGKFNKAEYNAVIRIGELMGNDYRDLLREIELIGGVDSVKKYESVVEEIETFIQDKNIDVMRSYLLTDGFNYVGGDSYRLRGDDKTKLTVNIIDQLLDVDLRDSEKFVDVSTEYGGDEIRKLKTEHEDDLTLVEELFYPKGSLLNDYYVVIYDNIHRKSVETDTEDLFGIVVLNKYRYVLLKTWEDDSISDVEYDLFKLYDDVYGTSHIEVIERLKEYPESVSVLNEFEDVKKQLEDVL